VQQPEGGRDAPSVPSPAQAQAQASSSSSSSLHQPTSPETASQSASYPPLIADVSHSSSSISTHATPQTLQHAHPPSVDLTPQEADALLSQALHGISKE
jgi:protein-tyrosine phosphatase